MNRTGLLLRAGLLRQLLFCIVSTSLIAWTVPFLVLLSGPVRMNATWRLLAAGLAGTAIGAVLNGMRIRRNLRWLRHIAAAKRVRSADVLSPLGRFFEEPSAVALNWLFPQVATMLLFLTPLRPRALDGPTSVSVGLVATLLLATAALPLAVQIRHTYLRVFERLPRVMVQRLVTSVERSDQARGRINLRLVLAVMAPVAFVTLGCALIVNAHLRRADEQSRRETARILVRAALDAPDSGGLAGALHAARAQGFDTRLGSHAPEGVSMSLLSRGGVVEEYTPLQSGGAIVSFAASTIHVVSLAPLLVSLLAAVAAGVLGYLLGNVLTTDLYYATRGVRLLGANPSLAVTGAAVIRRARLRIVAELFEAIESLAGRFTVFAQAQEDAITARAAATRMRGLFFASVSHDLKGPLNSILGFAHLVSLQPLTQGQRESLDAIESRAQELLALIETILDAARVEEGQLSLVTEEVEFHSIYQEAIEKAGLLSGGNTIQIYDELDARVPLLLVDRARTVRALATLLAYSIRTNKEGKMWVRAEREAARRLRVDIDIPNPAHAPEELEMMLSPRVDRGKREHRGLALGLRLARSVVELHRGAVRVVDRGKKGAMFCVSLPTVDKPLPTASAPLASVPPPPESWRPPRK